MTSASWLAGLDPGRSKCGLALAALDQRRIVEAAVLPADGCLATLQRWQGQGLQRLLLGNGTESGPWRERLAALGLAVVLVDERGTTLAARARYWQLHPPRGLQRLVPEGLRLPPGAIDDVVAQLLLERHLGFALNPPGQNWARTVKA